MRTTARALFCLGVLGGSFTFAQQYRCDWSVVGMGGGEMASSEYRCFATAGQTAAGFMTCPDYWALIGFWLPQGQEGIEGKWTNGQVVKTKLYSPFPVPFSRTVTIRYSLASDVPAMLEVFDRIGRQVRSWAVQRPTWASSHRRPSAVSQLTWDGRDAHGRGLANGVYFLKFTAGSYQQTEKLVMQR